MKKVLSATKSSSPSKFVRRVFNKNPQKDPDTSTNDLTNADCQDLQDVENKEEIQRLQNRIDDLTKNVQCLEKMSDTKERAIGTLARDKERLASELRKQRRSSVSLRQQLEDERNFYMKEKQQYCNEMNESKRNRRKQILSSKLTDNDKKNTNSLKQENTKIKEALEEAVATNHNLCVKFMRMKNTKDDLKKRFQRYQRDHAKILDDMASKLDDARTELQTVISEQFQNPLTVSNRKYLEVVKKNNVLIHENLCLKVQLEHTVNEIEKLRSLQVKAESKSQYPLYKKPSKGHTANQPNERGDFAILSLDKDKQLAGAKDDKNINQDSSKIELLPKSPKKACTLSAINQAESHSEESQIPYLQQNVTFSSDCCSETCRTQSAPEIIQTMEFTQIRHVPMHVSVRNAFTNT